jgi:hypothetical protein
MAPQTYTLILTQGVHTIEQDGYDAIRAAVERGDKFVEVQLDFFGKSEYATRATLIVSHVVAMAESSAIGTREVARSRDQRLQLLR